MKLVTARIWLKANQLVQLNFKNSSQLSIMCPMQYYFSMLSLSCILISHLVVANLFKLSIPGMILLYLAAPLLHLRCFCMSCHSVLQAVQVGIAIAMTYIANRVTIVMQRTLGKHDREAYYDQPSPLYLICCSYSLFCIIL